MKYRNLTSIVLGLSTLVFSCNSTSQSTEVTSSTDSLKSITGIKREYMDTTLLPGNNFFMYVNGQWIQNTPIPASESRWGAFTELYDLNQKALKDIIDEVSSGTHPEGSPEAMLADFVASGMDITAVNQAGFGSAKKFFDQEIMTLDDKKQLSGLLGKMHLQQMNPLFYSYVGADAKNSQINVFQTYQGGLSLPDISFYTIEEPRYISIKKAYAEHLTKMFKLAGYEQSDAVKAAADVLRIETAIAKSSKKREELREPEKNYTKITIPELQKAISVIQWNVYFEALGITPPEHIIIGQIESMKGIDQILSKESLSAIKSYFAYHYLKNVAPYLSDDFEKESFSFYSGTIRGISEPKERWKNVLNEADDQLGDLLGQHYVKKNFSPEAKAKMEELIADLKAAMTQHIKNLEWMSDETKAKAQKKLDAIIYKIGYPDQWKSYEGLTISKNDYVNNIIEARKFNNRRELNKIGKPVDRKEWGMTPSTVNAYYNPSINEIVFPAGILQPPFFDPNADDASNYGGIGAVIGHELTHGFDDEGSKFDEFGNLSDWWAKEDREKFESLAKKLADQYNQYTVLDTVHVNGQMTLGENIADFGGVALAFDALKNKWNRTSKPASIDGFSPEQRFFISYGQIWRLKYTDEALLERIKSDVHSPVQYRVHGPLSNYEPFYEVFNITEGQTLYRIKEERVNIW